MPNFVTATGSHYSMLRLAVPAGKRRMLRLAIWQRREGKKKKKKKKRSKMKERERERTEEEEEEEESSDKK
ncbi:hypothetical protein GQ457_12G006680 [Hibiscus cannabinus]